MILGLVIGFVGAIPPGPVGLAVLRLGLTDGRAAGLRAGFGALLVDLPCVFVATEASAWAVAAVEAHLVGHPAALPIARLVGAAVLLGLGALWLVRPKKLDPTTPPASATSEVVVGVGLAIAHLPSPTFLPWLALISGTLQARGLLDTGPIPALAFTAGFGIGTFAWFALLATIGWRAREQAADIVLVAAQRLAGALLILFAGVLAFEALPR